MAKPCASLSRRAFLGRGALFVAGLGAVAARGQQPAREAEPVLRVGLLTDMHYGDKPPAGSRIYRDALRRIGEAVRVFRDRKADFVVTLGDTIDEAPDAAGEAAWLEAVDKALAAFPGDRHYVPGNHDLWSLTRKEFLEHSAAKPTPWSFDRDGFHFVALDPNYRWDGASYGRRNAKWTECAIPQEQLDWLAKDLAASKRPAIVFIHQRLDIAGSYSVRDAARVRAVLEKTGRVRAVFQGHQHANDFREIGGIHYVTLQAMVEGGAPGQGAFGLLELFADGRMKLTGFRGQTSYDLSSPS